ncbi:MAG: T9SS type A sorting domain-containing protein [Melioribacteraceae bacterium]|nr:T9SS type A sorting domain-containing protein [Melioribacteraceae bacterium]MCF8353931.1 T9SS type A sorting domain-containing protein [Melioribacteraceae bacterium]MCF8392688.1 T9SS type A sorting domain-containing protein [Melioribacteraceae bacterium]MCF8417709.1 T9SS type A sorting domain-containing protein [Melioribacteraceae bacterium]
MLKLSVGIIAVFMLLFVNIYAQDYYWSKSDNPEGGVVYSVLVQNDTLIIGSKGGIYYSENWGEVWKPMGLHSVEVWSISYCVDYLIARTSDGCYRKKTTDTDWLKIKDGRFQALATKDSLIFLGSGYAGIYRSKDCGLSWQQINNGIDNRDIEKIHITASNIILASAAGASGSGVFRSLDFGDSWTRIDPYQYAWNFHGISEVNKILYAFDSNNSAKVYKSTDSGLTWFLPSRSSAPSDIINSIHADSDNLFAGVYHYGFFCSSNEGAGWSNKNTGLQNFTILEINSNSSELFMGTYDGFYKTDKDAINWEKHMNGISDVHIHSISQNSDYVFLGSYGSGLFRVDKNLENWQKMYMGQNNMYVSSVLALDEIVFVLISSWTGTMYQKLFVSTNNGASWSKLNPDIDSAELETIVGNDDVQFIGSGYGVYRSTNLGNSWIKMGNGMPNNVNSSSIAVYDSVVIVTDGTSGVYRSVDLGENWTYNYVPNLNSGKAISVSSEGVFYLGSASINRLFKSEDFGQTWAKLNTPLSNSDVNSIGINGNTILCGLSNNGVIMSSDGGVRWVENNLGLASEKVNCVSISDGQKLIGTNSGLYSAISSEITPIIDHTDELNQNSFQLRWEKSPGIDKYHIQISTDSLFQSTLIDQEINDTSFAVNNLEFMTTYFWRVSTVTDYWKNKFSPIQKVFVGNPINYELYDIYPNPFNNETNIRIDVPFKSEINLIIFNILGEKVITIANSVVEAGSHHYKLRSDNLASGIYLVRLLGDNYSNTKKIVLLR